MEIRKKFLLSKGNLFFFFGLTKFVRVVWYVLAIIISAHCFVDAGILKDSVVDFFMTLLVLIAFVEVLLTLFRLVIG